MPSLIRYPALAAALLVIAAAAGCSEGRKQPPKTTVTVVDAAPGFGTINFLREQHPEASLDFPGTSGTLVFDEDQYDFNITTTPPGASSSELLDTFSKDVVHGTDYLFVLTQEGGAVEHLIFEKPPFSSTTDAEIIAVHAAASQAPMDVYITASGTDIGGATPLGSVAFKQGTSPGDLSPGDYVVTLTEPGNPANVLFTSDPVTLTAGTSTAFVIVDQPVPGLAPLTVLAVGPTGGQLFDKNAPAGLEFVNAAADGAPRDVYLDDDFTMPLLSAVPSAVLSEITVPAGDRKLSVTPAGNPGVVELEQSFSGATGRRLTMLLAGDPGSLAMTGLPDDPRPIAGQSRVRFMDAATLFTSLNFYVVVPGTDLSTVLPFTTLSVAGVSARVVIPPGTYDLVVQDATSVTTVAGPQSITLTDSGVETILVTNGTTSGTVDVVLLQGFN